MWLNHFPYYNGPISHLIYNFTSHPDELAVCHHPYLYAMFVFCPTMCGAVVHTSFTIHMEHIALCCDNTHHIVGYICSQTLLSRSLISADFFRCLVPPPLSLSPYILLPASHLILITLLACLPPVNHSAVPCFLVDINAGAHNTRVCVCVSECHDTHDKVVRRFICTFFCWIYLWQWCTVIVSCLSACCVLYDHYAIYPRYASKQLWNCNCGIWSPQKKNFNICIISVLRFTV